MGTRGAYGFYKKGVNKIAYNHYDSYPTSLGLKVVDFINKTSVEKMNEIFDKIILVNEDDIPTDEQIKDCKEYLNLDVGSKTEKSWYSLLRNAQGDLSLYDKDLKYMIDYWTFLKDSLFCEWGYVINLNTNRLEIYRGFQKTKPPYNRYLHDHDSGENFYYNCKLIKKYTFEDLVNVTDEELHIFTEEIYEMEKKNEKRKQ